MLAFWVLPLAFATGIRFEEVNCPYGEGTVRKYHKVSGNTHGGYDSDLAVYSTRGQFREYAISTCPSNYFSTMGSDLDMVVPASRSKAIDAAIKASRQTWVNPDAPEVWERYDTAARIARALNRDSLTVAEFYLNASWTARDKAVGVYVGGLNGPSAAREILQVGHQELTKNLTPEATKVLLYNLARVAHRGGYSTARTVHLDAYLDLPSLTDAERSAGLRLKRMATHIEPALQTHAVLALKEALAVDGPPIPLARARYQLADLQRRLGQFEAARRDFHLVIASEDAPQELKDMAKFLLEELSD